LNKIILYVRPNIIINGILFYCIEHFLYLTKKTDIELCIIYNGDINDIKNIIKEKYFITNNELLKIKQIKRTNLLKENINKALVLDTDTYNIIKNFSKKINKIFLYSNDDNYSIRPQDIAYGFYDYQKFDIKERLKLGLQFMKPIIPSLKKTFCSYLIEGSSVLDKDTVNKRASYDVTYKNFQKDLNILSFKEIVYFHTGNIDRNNRLIPEAFYFSNNIILINNENTNDSINERYNVCLNKNLNELLIDENYKIVKDFLKENDV